MPVTPATGSGRAASSVLLSTPSPVARGRFRQKGSASKSRNSSRIDVREPRSSSVKAVSSQVGPVSTSTTPDSRNGCTVSFSINGDVPDTDDVKIVGNIPELGSWDVDLAPSLLCARDKSFRRLRCLPADTELVFKVVRIPNGANGVPVQPDDDLDNVWEAGENRVVTTGPAGSGLRVMVDFGGGMNVQEGNAQDLQTDAANMLDASLLAAASVLNRLLPIIPYVDVQMDASTVLDAAQLAAATAAALEDTTYEVELICADSPYDGRELRVVGSCAALGFWAIESGVVLRRQGGGSRDGGFASRVRLPAEEVVELKLVEVDLDGNNPVWQEGPNVQLDVRFGVANPRLQLSMGSFQIEKGSGSIYSDDNINSDALDEMQRLLTDISDEPETYVDNKPPKSPDGGSRVGGRRAALVDAMSESMDVLNSVDDGDGSSDTDAEKDSDGLRAAIDNAKESLLKGRGAGTLAATVAASVASKVSSGSMMKVSEDSPKDKTESVKTEEKKKEDRGSRWWVKDRDPEVAERRKKLAQRQQKSRDPEAAAERARQRSQSAGRGGGNSRARKSFAAMAQAPGASKRESRSSSRSKDSSSSDEEDERAKRKAEAEARIRAESEERRRAQEKARQEKLEEKKAADNRRLSALQEARDAAAAAAQTRAELSAKTEEERKMRAEKAKEAKVAAKVSNGVTKPMKKSAASSEEDDVSSNGSKDEKSKSSAAERAAARRRGSEGGARNRRRSMDQKVKRGTSPSRGPIKAGGKVKELGKGLGKPLASLRQDSLKKQKQPWWESQSEGSQKAIMYSLMAALVISGGILYEEIQLYGNFRNTIQNSPTATTTTQQKLPPLPEQLGNATKKLASDTVGVFTGAGQSISNSVSEATKPAPESTTTKAVAQVAPAPETPPPKAVVPPAPAAPAPPPPPAPTPPPPPPKPAEPAKAAAEVAPPAPAAPAPKPPAPPAVVPVPVPIPTPAPAQPPAPPPPLPIDTPKAELRTAPPPTPAAPKPAEAPKADAPKAEAPKAEAPKSDAPKADAQKPASDAPKPITMIENKKGEEQILDVGAGQKVGIKVEGDARDRVPIKIGESQPQKVEVAVGEKITLKAEGVNPERVQIQIGDRKDDAKLELAPGQKVVIKAEGVSNDKVMLTIEKDGGKEVKKAEEKKALEASVVKPPEASPPKKEESPKGPEAAALPKKEEPKKGPEASAPKKEERKEEPKPEEPKKAAPVLEAKKEEPKKAPPTITEEAKDSKVKLQVDGKDKVTIRIDDGVPSESSDKKKVPAAATPPATPPGPPSSGSGPNPPQPPSGGAGPSSFNPFNGSKPSPPPATPSTPGAPAAATPSGGGGGSTASAKGSTPTPPTPPPVIGVPGAPGAATPPAQAAPSPNPLAPGSKCTCTCMCPAPGAAPDDKGAPAKSPPPLPQPQASTPPPTPAKPAAGAPPGPGGAAADASPACPVLPSDPCKSGGCTQFVDNPAPKMQTLESRPGQGSPFDGQTIAPDTRFPHFNFFQGPSDSEKLQDPASKAAVDPNPSTPPPPPTKKSTTRGSEKEVAVNVPGFGYLRYIEVPDVELVPLKGGMGGDVSEVEMEVRK